MSGQDENRKRAMSWTDWGTMSQWADNTDRLNQWAESRRRFSVFVFVCVFLWGGEWRGCQREDVPRFSGGLLQGVNTSPAGLLRCPQTILQPKTHRLKITPVPLSKLDFSPPPPLPVSHTNRHTVALLSCKFYVLTHAICFLLSFTEVLERWSLCQITQTCTVQFLHAGLQTNII